MKKIILASASPRRADLLKQLGLKFQVFISDADEEIVDLPPDEFVKNIALQKARIVSGAVSDGIIIAADTIVVIDGKIIGKPRDVEEACDMLTGLSGRMHEVFTGLCILEKPSGRYFLGYERTEVYFRNISQAEIKTYIATGEPMDKAGAYGIQGKGALFVEKINGCYFNVVGLPLTLLYNALAGFDVNLLEGSE